MVIPRQGHLVDLVDPVGISLVDFLWLLSVLRRLSELLSLNAPLDPPNPRRSGTPAKTCRGATLDECSICCNRTENVVLSCSHSLCHHCERRWVVPHRACPFCRNRFSSTGDVRQNAWELTRWSETDVQTDIADLSDKLEAFWIKARDFGFRVEDYTEIQRSLDIPVAEMSGFVVVNHQAKCTDDTDAHTVTQF